MDCCGHTPPSAKTVRVSPEVAAQMLLHKEEVICKQHGMSAHVTGTVVLEIKIGHNGSVLHSKVVSGPAMLVPAALSAIRKYHYKPYLLNGKPVSVFTRVMLPFECPNQ